MSDHCGFISTRYVGHILAHQGGWDEMLIVAAILLTFWWILKHKHKQIEVQQPPSLVQDRADDSTQDSVQGRADNSAQGQAHDLAQDTSLELSQDDTAED